MRMSALFKVKISDFSKFVVCPHGQGGKGLIQEGREGQFLRFFTDVFYGRPLTS